MMLDAVVFVMLTFASPAGDQKNSIIQWLSRSNTDFPASQIPSSKAPSTPTPLLKVQLHPQASCLSLSAACSYCPSACSSSSLPTFHLSCSGFVVWDDIWRIIGSSGIFSDFAEWQDKSMKKDKRIKEKCNTGKSNSQYRWTRVMGKGICPTR